MAVFSVKDLKVVSIFQVGQKKGGKKK